MKNISNKVLIFYTFQLENQNEYNMTALKSSSSNDARIRDVLASLPIDLSQGKYHFRFKTEFSENNETIVGWIDISNLMAKVPMINSCVYIKILALKHEKFNKLFNIEKLKKADVLNGPISQSKKNISPSSPSPQSSKKLPSSSENIQKPPGSAQNPSVSPPSAKSTKIIQPSPNLIAEDINFFPVSTTPTQKSSKTGCIHEDSAAKLQRFQEGFKAEEQAKEEERLAKEELQDQINKWGYTEGKKINNTPTLLATLHEIWPEWERVSLADLLTQQYVNIQFKKAVIKVHPDKNRNQHFKKKYLAKRVFELLNESRKM